jgi:uncharacterized protein YjdB
MANNAALGKGRGKPLGIQISPQNQPLPVGGTLTFSASQDGGPVAGGVCWDSNDPTIATIDFETGEATGIKVGSVAITATAKDGWAIGSLVLNVTKPELKSISIAPSNQSIAKGSTLPFTAKGYYSDNSNVDITSQVTWISSNIGVAAFNTPNAGPGVAKGVDQGTTYISASAISSSGAVVSSSQVALTVGPAVLSTITVTPSSQSIAVGQTQQFTATATYSDGSTPPTQVTWSSSQPGNATIDPVSGFAKAIAVGSTNITASATSSSGTVVTSPPVALTVTSAVLTGITITPATASIKPGGTQQFTALANYSDGSSQPLTSGVTWSSSSPGVAGINNTGLATGVTIGSTTISASYGGFNGSASLSVPAPVVQSIALSASRSYVGAGQTLQITVTATYQDGTTQTIKPTANNTQWWTSLAGLVSINNAGLVTGVSSGKVDITATYTDTNGKKFDSPALTLNVLPNFTDIGAPDTQAFMNAKSRVNQLLTAFERRGNLSDAETAQLNDGLELVTEYVNNNPTAPIPNFNAASKAGNNVSDLELLGITWNITGSPGPGSSIGTGSGKANVIDDTFRAIGDYLYGKPPLVANGVSLEHDPGTFPFLTGTANPPGLTYDQMRMAAVYGYVRNAAASAPPYRTDPSLVTPDDNNRRVLFNQTVEAADADFRTNGALYTAALTYMVQNSQRAQINATDWAKVVGVLVSQGIDANNPQLNTWIERALATAQNVGQNAPPSQISINLPDLEQTVSNFEIIPDNIFALQPAYFCSMLEELKVFQVVEKLVELFQNGVLPVLKGSAGNQLFNWWKNAALRVSEAERRGFYARALGFPGGDADSPNREFKGLFMRFVSAVSSFVRQNTIDNIVRSNIPGAISQQQVRKSARDLATNISSHGYGIAYPMATELQQELTDVMAILTNGEIQAAYGAKDMWQLVDQVAALELGGNKNSVKYRTMASAGAVVFAWLANRAQLLATNAYAPILDITQLQLPPSFSTTPTKDPSDFDLTGACDQWLAVTGTQEDTVEEQAQPIEAPVMPSRPIQIPSVARDMLESVGIPAMSYAAGASNGKAKNGGANWRLK